jgi:Protein of unknown function (DUF2550)
MLIALLAVLGVDLSVIVVLLAVVLARKRWVSHQPGAFKGAIRIIDGDVPGLKTKWKRGYGRWVREILVWTKAPFLFRNELVAADGPAGDARGAKHPTIVPLTAGGGARIEVAASAAGRERASGPFAAPAPGTKQPLTGHADA